MWPTVPAAATEPCADPVSVPDRDLTERETVSYWGRDRASLKTCEGRRRVAVDAIKERP